MKLTYSRFATYALSEQELAAAASVSAPLLCYLQNKMAAYAEAVVNYEIQPNPDPGKQMETLMELHRLKAFVAAYDELIGELQDSVSTDTPVQS